MSQSEREERGTAEATDLDFGLELHLTRVLYSSAPR